MINDPKFTAYALNELDEAEKNELLQKLKNEGFDEEKIASEVEQIQKTAKSLNEEFKKDEILRLSVEKREALFPVTPLWKKIFNFKMAASVASLTLVVMVGHKAYQVNYKADVALDHYQEVSKENKPFQAKTQRKKDLSANAKATSRFRPTADQKFGVSAGLVSTQKAQSSKKVGAKYKKSKRQIHSRSRLSTSNLSMGHSRSAQPQAESMNDIAKPSSSTVYYNPIGRHPVEPPIGIPPVVKPGEKFNREAYDKIETNKYTLVQNQPLSTFSVDVDTASYANMRRFLMRGALPPKDSIRVEEVINYFHYDYDLSHKKHPVAIKVDQSKSPWNKDRKLVRVALEADSPSDLVNANKNLVFLLDVSGSMRAQKKLPLLKESMRLLVRKLKKTDTISLVVYAGASGVVLEPTPISEKLKIFKALDNLNAGGSTNAGSGIIAAYKMAKQNFIKGGVNRVILATDGDFNVGTTSQSALIDLVSEKAKDDIFLTVVGLGMGNFQDSMLENLSNKGNGNYAYIDSLSEANKLFNVDLEKNMTTVAKDVKVQVEFNPAKVKAYRLIGYENRMLAAQDFNDDKKDAGEMGAGHTVTALYEIVPAGGKIDVPKVDKLKYAKKVEQKATGSDELLTVKVRYKKPTETTSTKFDIVLKDGENEFKKMDNDFRFATTAASFAMKLRGDDLASDLTYRDLEKMAKDAKGNDPYDFKEEFIELIDLAKQIDK